MRPFLRKQYWIFLLFITTSYSCQKKLYNACFQSVQNYEVKTDTLWVDTAVNNLLAHYHKKISSELLVTIAKCEQPLSKAQPESNLGNLVADAVFSTLNSEKKVDAAIIHYWSIQKEYLAPGNITMKDIFELFPNNDKIVLISVPGNLLQQICDSIAQFKGMPIAGIRIVIAKNNKAINVEVNHTPLKDNLVYTIAVNSFLLQSKTFKSVLGPISNNITSLNLRNTLITYLIETNHHQPSFKPVLDNRISYAE